MSTVIVPDLFKLYPNQDDFDYEMHDQIQVLLSQYCFCPSEAKPCLETSFDKTTQGEELVMKHPMSRQIKSRKKNKLLKSRNTQEGLERLQRIISNQRDDGSVMIRRSPKSKNSVRDFKSGRRSSYIGVSRNGDVWQALIMIDSKKTYIGSYHTEEEAATAYDFYSITMKQFAAKTNFDYTLTHIKNMVQNYYDNACEFIPSTLF